MPKILIVDNECLTRLEIEGMLTDLGYDVAGQAETGAEAVAMARELNPDLILMDVKMPGEMNGIDAAREIKAELKIPIIFISGYGDPEYIEAAKEIASFGYVMKPFDEREVHAFVEIALSRKKLELKLEKSHERLEYANLDLRREIAARKETERKLQESEEKYRTLVETNPYGFLEIDSKWIITYTNATFQKMVGYSREELSGESILNLFEPAPKRDELREYISLMVKEQPLPTTFFQRLRAKDDRVVHMEVAWRYVQDNERRAVGFSCIVTDVTDRKQMEVALRESQEKYSKLFHSNPQWLSIATVEDGRYVEVNDAVKEITGYERDELIGRTSKELGLFADYEKRSRFVKVAQEQGGFREKEVAMIKKNGEHVSVLWSAATIEIMGTAYFINSVADISERKQAENKLKESEERFRMFFEQAGDAVFVHNLEEQYVEVNERACSSLGYSKDELMAISAADIEVGWEPKDLHELWGNLKANKVITATGEQRRKDGSTFPVEVRLRSIQRDGQKLMMVMARDISFRKQAEEALMKSEERFRTVADFTYDWEYWVAPDGHYVYVSPSCERITGYTPDEFINDPGLLEKIVHPDDQSTFVNHIGEEQKLEKLSSFEFRIITRSREERWISHLGQRVHGVDGAFMGRRGSNRDISKRKQMEEELLKEREKDLEGKKTRLEELNTALKVLLEKGDKDREELEEKSELLKDANTALKVMLQKSAENRKDIKKEILLLVINRISPYVSKLKECSLDEKAVDCVEIIESNIKNIVYPFSKNTDFAYVDLTPREIRIANLIKQDKSTKEISIVLGLAKGTIDVHRNNIREKLELKNKSISLKTYLASLR